MEDIDSCNNRGFHFDSSMDGQNDGRAVDGTDECHDERRNGGAMQNRLYDYYIYIYIEYRIYNDTYIHRTIDQWLNSNHGERVFHPCIPSAKKVEIQKKNTEYR